MMDVYDKSFYGRLDKIVENNKVLSDIANSDGNKVSKTCLLYTSDAADEE